MKNVIALILLLIACADVRAAFEPTPAEKVFIRGEQFAQVPTPKVVPFNTAPEVANPVAPAAGRRDLTLRERRELGVTVVNVARIVKQLNEAGEIDKESGRTEIAAAVAGQLIAENQAGFKSAEKVGAINWDKLIALIEQLLKIVMIFF